MALQPFPLAVSYGQTDAVKNSGGYLINMMAEVAPQDAKTPVTLIGTPGLRPFASLGQDPVINMLEINGRLYAVTYSGFFRIFADGGTFRLGNLLLRPTCSLATNAVHVVMTDGNRIFAYEMRDDEEARYQSNAPFEDFIEELTNEPNYHPANTVTALDQMLIFPRNDTRQVYNTGLLDLAVDPLAFTSAESRPDNAMAVIENLQQLFVIGNRTFEVWYNSGSGESPFVRIEGARGDHGTTAPYTVKSFRNTVFWLDQNGVVVAANGYQPQPISTVAIEDLLRGRDFSKATAVCYTDAGHDIYMLTVEDVTVAFDISTGLWHRRKSWRHGRHVTSCLSFSYGKNLVGSAFDGTIYELTREAYDDDGDPLVAEIIPPPLDVAFQMGSHHSFEIDIDVGSKSIEEPAPAGPVLWETTGGEIVTTETFEPIEFFLSVGVAMRAPYVGLEMSSDEGVTWGGQRLRPMGKLGEYRQRVRWQRNGQGRQRRYRLQISDPVKRSMVSRAWIDIS